jgi:excisionase family DNA binding protein
MSNDSDVLSIFADRIANQVRKILDGYVQAAAAPQLAYSIKQAAATLSLSESTVEHMIRDRELPVIKCGTRRLISRDALEKWIERSET